MLHPQENYSQSELFDFSDTIKHAEKKKKNPINSKSMSGLRKNKSDYIFNNNNSIYISGAINVAIWFYKKLLNLFYLPTL